MCQQFEPVVRTPVLLEPAPLALRTLCTGSTSSSDIGSSLAGSGAAGAGAAFCFFARAACFPACRSRSFSTWLVVPTRIGSSFFERQPVHMGSISLPSDMAKPL